MPVRQPEIRVRLVINLNGPKPVVTDAKLSQSFGI